MIKILFVDERAYRFDHYYENKEWWMKYGIKSIFKSYEHKYSKYYIYLWAIINKPDYIVYVQTSIKNIVLAKLANILGIRTIFWQHGVFSYDLEHLKKIKSFKVKLDYLLALSEYDEKNLQKYYINTFNKYIMCHYESGLIIHSRYIENSILYIGQIISKEQHENSNSILEYNKMSERILEHSFDILSKSNYIIYLKKHPGDHSSYLDNLCKKYQNFHMIKDHIIPDIVIGHYSTLFIPYLNMGKQIIQLFHPRNKDINFQNYSETAILELNSIEDTKRLLNIKYIKKTSIPNNQINSISELIKNITTYANK